MKGTVANPVRTWQESLRPTVFQLSVQLPVQLPSRCLPGAFQVRPATLLAHCYPYNPGELEAPTGLWGLGSGISRGVRHARPRGHPFLAKRRRSGIIFTAPHTQA